MAGKKRDDLRPFASEKISWNVSRTTFSDWVCPSLSASVESESNSRTPSAPAKLRRAGKSVPTPSEGNSSILKSPVCTTFPTGVSTARAYPCGMGMAHRNEMETQAAERQLVFGGHGNEFGPVEEASFTELVLHERQRHVSETFRPLIKETSHGTAPMWSSCPCVSTTPSSRPR